MPKASEEAVPGSGFLTTAAGCLGWPFLISCHFKWRFRGMRGCGEIYSKAGAELRAKLGIGALSGANRL